MRLVILGLSLVLTASAPLAATAQAPVTTQPLAQGEVLLEITALGMVTTRADRATLSFNITGSGATEAEARTATETSVREVRAALRGLGVADADIQVQPVSAHTVEAAETELTQMELNSASGEMSPVENGVEAGPSASGNAPALVTVRNIDRVPAIQAMLMQRGIFSVAGATYALNDEAVPRREARAQALQKARADAEAYAASLNMRVARIVRVTERLGLEMLGMAASESQLLTQLFSPGAMRATGPMVPTMVVVGVDFALVPR